MKSFVLLFFCLGIICTINAQSIDIDQIFVTKYQDQLFFEKGLNTKVKKNKSKIIHILEYNDQNQITRELLRISDSTYLYTSYYPLSFEHYVVNHGEYAVYQQGELYISEETRIDSSIMYDYDTYETLPNPRFRKILKPIGAWVQKYYLSYGEIKGTFNKNGKEGLWKYYHKKINLEKTKLYKDNKLVNETFINLLHHKSVQITKDMIQKSWRIDNYYNTLSTDITKYSNIVTFHKDGSFTFTTNQLNKESERTTTLKKGTWSVIDFETIRYTIDEQKTDLKLNYLSEKMVRY